MKDWLEANRMGGAYEEYRICEDYLLKRSVNITAPSLHHAIITTSQSLT